MSLVFVTSNKNKFEEAEKIAEKNGINLEHFDTSYIEIQADNLEEVVKYSVKQVVKSKEKPCFLEDAGLFINSLNEFPGPYSAYVFKTIGNRGIIDLMNNLESRKAEFKSVIGYTEPNNKLKIFEGKVTGKISPEIRGSKGFGFDPIFIPDGEKRTFAEMPTETKNSYSHRGKAIEKLVKWYVRNKKD